MINRDSTLILLTRLLRAAGFGFAQVLLGLHLAARGLSPAAVGLTLAIGLFAGALGGLPLAWLSRRSGRRRALALTGLLMALTGLLLALVPSGPLLVLSGLTGMLGAAGLDVGPFQSVEQPLLAESVDARSRNVAFGRYSLAGALAGAAGGLASGLAGGEDGMRWFFIAFALLGLTTALLPLLLSPRVEGMVDVAAPRFDVRPLAGLAGLFALDALGGGFIANSVIAYWLHVRFGATSAVIGPAFAAIGLLQAAGYELSGRLGDRIGLVNTMVFTHLPSNVLLLLVPLAPSLPWALGLLLLRFSMSQMDVPARQAYIVSIVPAEHRAAAVATTAAARGLGLGGGPFLSGLAIGAAAFGIPFWAGGGLKIVYDLALYAGFRRRRAEHEPP